MDPRTAELLRYRFNDPQQMRNHLHVVEGRTLFFWRDGKGALPGGTRVVLEFSFSTSDQVAVARGQVLGRIETVDAGEGPITGLWLELPDAKLARRLEQGLDALSARRQRRLGCDLVVEVRGGKRPYMGRMIDVSMSGARITGTNPLLPGAQIALRPMGGGDLPSDLGPVQVVRADASEIGVRFLRSDAPSRMATTQLFQQVQKSWASAPELVHPALCCRGGHVIEPSLPHVRGRL